ncbi:hypothetical protein [Snodgrassella gandavensis]|uniref:hypothetical protein n=1 Tax=Snodgrassella gandavensis TaxID=2946698 RepID=UPI001EF6379C|nr:hypothetical protein [Snodgrassella gandavensis]
MGCDCNQSAQAQRDSSSNYERKQAICTTCAEINRWVAGTPPGAPVHILDRCSQCGCFIKPKAKIWGLHCPLDKW